MKPNHYQALKCLVVSALFATSISATAQNNNISITQQLPEVVTAGDAFDVTFTINKDNLQSFARLQQTLPPGFTAKLKHGKDYRAYLNGNKAKMVWISLPNDKEFTVTYRVKVSRKISGDFKLGGEFSYVENDKRQFAVVQPAAITVMPNAMAALEDEGEEESMPVGGSTAYEENIFDK